MAISGNASGGDPSSDSSLVSEMSGKSTFLGLRLYILIAIFVGCLAVVAVFIFLCFLYIRSSRKQKMRVKHSSGIIPLVSKEIVEIKLLDRVEKGEIFETMKEVKDDKGAENAVREKDGDTDRPKRSEDSDVSIEVQSNIGWGRWYNLKELEVATGGFSEENVVGEGGYGVVFRGVLPDGSVVAVKNLLNNKGQAEKEFKVEVEAIGKVRHKNLVGLVGYCADGAQRMLVYEYIDNGNLEQWLHGDVGPISPLTWDIRMRIAIGTAKGYDILIYNSFYFVNSELGSSAL